MRLSLKISVLVALMSGLCVGQETVFSGMPVTKISEGGVERTVEDIKAPRSAQLMCIITKVGDKYFWSTREGKEMVRLASGAFITFLAVDGAGYVRVLLPEMKAVASLTGEAEKRFDYVEHLQIGLRSVTYYGNRSGR